MKSVFAMILISAVSSFASVKITSFNYVRGAGPNADLLPLAEICGRLTSPTGKPEMIKILVDPSSKSPGQYFTWAGKEGKFCTTVTTYSGTAEASIE